MIAKTVERWLIIYCKGIYIFSANDYVQCSKEAHRRVPNCFRTNRVVSLALNYFRNLYNFLFKLILQVCHPVNEN